MQLKSNVLIIPLKLDKPQPAINLYLNNTLLLQVSSAKYLGITLDANLALDQHIAEAVHKISRSVGIISKLKHYKPKKALLSIYCALVHFNLLYALPIWGSAYQSQLQKLITLQNKAIKLIGGGYPREMVTPFYSQLKVLKLPDLFKLEVGKLVHDHFQNKLPNNLSNLFFFLLETYL